MSPRLEVFALIGSRVEKANGCDKPTARILAFRMLAGPLKLEWFH
jgi:hypothetical protein